MKSFFWFLAFICLHLLSCQYDPYADDLVTKQPAIDDVVGIYTFESQTISDLKTNFANGSIELKPDSSFTAINIPNFTGTFNFQYEGLVSTKGKWFIRSNGAVATGQGKAIATWGIQLDSLPKNLNHMDFLGNQPHYKLIITYGDPDGGTVMILKKHSQR